MSRLSGSTTLRTKLLEIQVQELEPEVQQRLMDAYGNADFHKRCGYLGPKRYLLTGNKDLLENLQNFEIKDNDVWIGGFSRSGTHWLAELTWLIFNNLDYEKALAVPHEERVLYFDFNPRVVERVANSTEVRYNSYTAAFSGVPSPRYFKTHMPLSLLAPSLLDKAKMVYVARDPRDVVVSCYHFYKNLSVTQFRKDLKEFWDLFRNDHCVYCPYFENVKEYWAKRNHPNLLFLSYEEMHMDLRGTISNVAKFFGKSYSEEQFNSLYEHLQFSNMKKNKAVNFDEMLGDQAHEVVRKGVAGGWRKEFDEQMSKEAENWITKNLQDLGIQFSMRASDEDAVWPKVTSGLH